MNINGAKSIFQEMEFFWGKLSYRLKYDQLLAIRIFPVNAPKVYKLRSKYMPKLAKNAILPRIYVTVWSILTKDIFYHN